MGCALVATPLYRYLSLNMFDKRKINIITQFLFPLVSFVALGLVFVGDYVIDPNNTLFTFTIFGFSAILFYNLIFYKGFKIFLLISILFTILFLVTLLPTSDLIRNLRNITWFISIGVLTFIISQIENKTWYKSSKVWIVASWFVGFVLVYIIMALQNIYIYHFYILDANYNLFFYISQSIKLGGLLGFGIGLGLLISRTNGLVKNVRTV